MNWTNTLDIPDILAHALQHDDYTKGDADYSITQLLKPPQMTALERAHAHEMTKDVAEALHTVFGRATHAIIERSRGAGVAEERLCADLAGCRISGAPDYLQDGTINDWKTVKWKAVTDGPRHEWEQQLNGYAWLAETNGKPVTRLRAWALLKDWSRDLPHTDPECPRLPIVRFDLPLWPMERRVAFFSERVWLHEHARRQLEAGGACTPCTIEDRWGRGEHWVAIKPDAKRATKKFYGGTTEVQTWIRDQKKPGDYRIEHRPAVYVRCRAWCDAAPFCPQFRADPGGGPEAPHAEA